ncbi:MAG: LuxR family transcriptional regulator [Actinomycetota bacterium]|uniref:LuxR family transcriptional regulator n=1 Tax=Mycobacterium lentiflavum TaxID=141349 RepID=A0ABY3V674_MYCLN|nr:LuxR C-terminal-related transcriptional regulator [Mycobacterium lentiflavum]MEE3064450.1 LuxR family transcriptional regulator [Actinomycetota bacterium]ULP45094.1 LuxR family transcriptional regulator [Mycobacterium lentiflavum]
MAEMLPTGTVTLLLADVEGSTRLWQTVPDEMADAVARLDQVLGRIVAEHRGVRPVEQGEGDSFVLAFRHATDAVACALALQREPLAPIRVRIGVHTGEVQLRDEGNYIGSTINKAARLRDLAHGGQIVLSGAATELAADCLPPNAWLIELGTHRLRDLPRAERVVQLCHPDISVEFPPLRVAEDAVTGRLPVQLTSFIGRGDELGELRNLLSDNRLLTLTGAGGVGKTRLALELAAAVAGEFPGGAWCVDLAPIPHPDVIAVTVALALGLPDQPGISTLDNIVRFIGDRTILLVVDNCEHLLDGTASVITELLGRCPNLKVLATSREPLAVAGEVSWRVPSLSVDDDAVALFTDRAKRVRPNFRVTDDNLAVVRELCRRLDGLPLAIELAAARVRALSLPEIIAGLNDRFRLLTGGSRTAVRRQQTLHASVDWSHTLLTDEERSLFHSTAVFAGGFDLDAASFVCAEGRAERFHVVDQLTLLVDKSLVVAEEGRLGTRYRLLETIRQYAQEHLGASGQADAVRERHRDYYLAMATALDAPQRTDYEHRLDQVEVEMDNLRAALGWCLETRAIGPALTLASALFPLWRSRLRIWEGKSWFDTVFAEKSSDGDHAVDRTVWARALADAAALGAWLGALDNMQRAERALAIAREVDDPALLTRVLTSYGLVAGWSAVGGTATQACFDEAGRLARELGDWWGLSQIYAWQAYSAVGVGDARAARAAAEQGRDVAESIGDAGAARECLLSLGWALLMEADIPGAVAQFQKLLAQVEAARALFLLPACLHGLGLALAYAGRIDEARLASRAAMAAEADRDGVSPQGIGHSALAAAELAAGDARASLDASETARQQMSAQKVLAAGQGARTADAALATGDLTAARTWADEAVSMTTGWHLAYALIVRARTSLIEGRPSDAVRDARQALSCTAECGTYLNVPDAVECLAAAVSHQGALGDAVRLLAATAAIRLRCGLVRFKIRDEDYAALLDSLRESLAPDEFESEWSAGEAMSIDDVVAYAVRGRGARQRPDSGWASLTPAELDVVRFVCEGLGNKEIAARLLISPRTVQAHLSHVFTKLGLSSRVQLVQEAAKHG